MDYAGKLYRALNPIHARAPLSERGAELYGGRFNPRGMPALYTSLLMTTALREANQVGSLQPTTLVCYDAAIGDVFDSHDTEALEAAGMDEAGLADAARRGRMRENEAPTQAFARRLIASGYAHCWSAASRGAPRRTISTSCYGHGRCGAGEVDAHR